MTIHERSLLLAAQDVDFNLSEVQRDELDRHLAGCAECARRAAQLGDDAVRMQRLAVPVSVERMSPALVRALERPVAVGLRPLLVLAVLLLLLTAAIGGVVGATVLLRALDDGRTSIVEPTPTAMPTRIATPVPAPSVMPSPVVSAAPPSAPDRTANPPAVTPPASPDHSGQLLPVLLPHGQVPADADFLGVVGFSGGYIAFGQAPAAGEWARAWYSADGAEWQPSSPVAAASCAVGGSESPSHTIQTAATDGQSVLLLGTEATVDQTIGQCVSRAVSWITRDGRTWEQSPAFGEHQSGAFMTVWFAAGGWEATLEERYSDECCEEALLRLSVWRSPDGLAWQQSTHELWAPRPWMDTNHLAAAGADPAGTRLLATSARAGVGVAGEQFGAPGRPTVLRSDDGQSWVESVELLALAGEGAYVAHILPPGDRGSWLLVTHDAEDGNAQAWTSMDLVVWEPMNLPAASIQKLVATRHGPIAIGCNRRLSTCDQYISFDGLAWTQIESPAPAEIGALLYQRHVADGPAGTLVIDGASGTVMTLTAVPAD